MDGVTLLRRARDAGLRVESLGNTLLIRGPKRAGPVVKLLAEHKAEVLSALANIAHEAELLAPTPLFGRVTQPVESEPGLEQPCASRRGRVQELDGVFLHFCVECGRFGPYGYGVHLRAGWAPRRAALLSGRTIRVSVLLRADLCEPTRRLAPPRALIREQAFGEAFDAGKLESLGRYEVHLDRAVLLVPDDLAALERIATVAQKEMIVAFLEVFSDAPTLGLVDPAVGPTWGDLMPLQQWLAKQKSRNPKASANTKSVISIQQQCTFGREMIGD